MATVASRVRCAIATTARADGGLARREEAEARRGDRRTGESLPEERGSGQLSCAVRRAAHFTRDHGRRGEGRRVQAEDAYFQKR